MQAFTAKGTDEQWDVVYNGYILDKIITKRSEYHLIRKHTTITYLRDGKALGAFHAEKKKALKKFGKENMGNYDSTVKKPRIVGVKAVVRPKKNIEKPKMMKVFGRWVPVEG